MRPSNYPYGGVYDPHEAQRLKATRSGGRYHHSSFDKRGEHWDSELEWSYALYMDSVGIKYKHHPEKFEIIPKFKNGQKHHSSHTYTPDFVIFDDDGKPAYYVDTKSKYTMTKDSVLRMSLFALKHPETPLYIVKANVGLFTKELF